MANDVLGFPHDSAAATLYAIIRDRNQQAWSVLGTAFEAYQTANLDNYDIALAEQGAASRYYTLQFPGDIAAGLYWIVIHERAGASPAEGDAAVAEGWVYWDGASVVALTGDPYAKAADVEVDTQDIQSRLPGALVNGRIDAHAGAMATDAITAAAVSAAAVAKIEAALLNEGDGQALIDAIVQAIDDADIDTDILPGLVRDAILNRVLSGNHDTAGTVGKILQDAATAAAVAAVQAAADAVQAQTDKLAFSGTGPYDLKATLDGETVTVGGYAAGQDPRTLIEAAGSKVTVLYDDWLDGGRLDNLLDTAASGGAGLTAQQVRDALKLAPSAGDPASGSIDAHLDAIEEDTGTTLPAQIAALDVGSGSGSYACTWTVVDGNNQAVQNALVSFWDGATLAGTGTTDENGEVEMSLNAATYTVAITKPGYTHAPETHQVTSTTSTHTHTFAVAQQSITTSPAGQITGYADVYDENGDLETNVDVSLRMVTEPTTGGHIYDGAIRTEQSDANGRVEFTKLFDGAQYEYWRGGAAAKKTRIYQITVSDDGNGTHAMTPIVGGVTIS